MKVFRPEDSSHLLRVIPRKYILGELHLRIRNELRDVINEQKVVFENPDGYLTGEFNYNFSEGGAYEVEIFQEDTGYIVYRGKIYATNEVDLQNYKLTK